MSLNGEFLSQKVGGHRHGIAHLVTPRHMSSHTAGVGLISCAAVVWDPVRPFLAFLEDSRLEAPLFCHAVCSNV